MPWRCLILGLCLVALGCSPAADAPPTFSFDRALRPAAAGFGEVVAQVHLLKGTVQVRAANLHTFPARPGCPLLRGDSLLVGDGSFVVLHLRNNRLTRIEAKQEMKLADVALLDAAPSEVDLDQQLISLLSAEERDQPERIVGWHARKSAALTVGTEKEEALREQKAMKDVALKEAEGKAEQEEEKAEREEKKSSEDARQFAHRSLQGFGDDAARNARQGDDAASPPPPQRPPAKTPPAPSSTVVLQREPSPVPAAQPPRAMPARAVPPQAGLPEGARRNRAKAKTKIIEVKSQADKQPRPQGVLRLIAGEADGQGDAVADVLSVNGEADSDLAFRDTKGVSSAGRDEDGHRRAAGPSGGQVKRSQNKAGASMSQRATIDAWLLRVDGKWRRQEESLPPALTRLITSPRFNHCLGLLPDQSRLPRVLTVELIYRDGALDRLLILALPSKSRSMSCLRAAFGKIKLPPAKAEADLRILVRLR